VVVLSKYATATLGSIARGNDGGIAAVTAACNAAVIVASLRAHCRGHSSSELSVAIGCK